MNDQSNPLPRHGTPLFSPDEHHDFGSTNGSSAATRRKFLKKTGGATAATSLAWLASSRMAKASGGEDSLSPNDKTNEHVTKTTGDESPANPDTSIKGYARVYRKRFDGTKGAEVFNIEPYWQFSWTVTLGGEAQEDLVKEDCANCKISNVVVELLGVQGVQGVQGFTPPQYAGPNLTRGHTITAEGDCSSTSCKPKIGVAAIGGDPDEQQNSITVGITSTVVTVTESKKRIDWTQTESNNIDVSVAEGNLLSSLQNNYAPDDHIFEINFPNVPGTGHACSQIVESQCTEEEVGDGAGCPL